MRKLKLIIFPLGLFFLIVIFNLITDRHSMNISKKFCAAVFDHDQQKINSLLDENWNVNSYTGLGWFMYPFNIRTLPLIEACQFSDYKTVEKLLVKGANPNKYNDWNPAYAALLRVRINGYEDSIKKVQLLIKYGADFSLLPKEYSPLNNLGLSVDDTKIEKEYSLELTQLLIDNNASIEGTHIIDLASQYNHVEILKYLIDEKKIDVNLAGVGENALIEAAKGSSYEAAEYLLSVGADLSNKDENGKTALDYAEGKNDKKMIEILSLVDGLE